MTRLRLTDKRRRFRTDMLLKMNDKITESRMLRTDTKKKEIWVANRKYYWYNHWQVEIQNRTTV